MSNKNHKRNNNTKRRNKNTKRKNKRLGKTNKISRSRYVGGTGLFCASRDRPPPSEKRRRRVECSGVDAVEMIDDDETQGYIRDGCRVRSL